MDQESSHNILDSKCFQVRNEIIHPGVRVVVY